VAILRWVGVVMVAIVLAGCASGSGERVRTDTSRLTADEIMSVAGASTVHDVVARLRPRWLQTRGPRTVASGDPLILVFQGQTRLGGVEALRQVAPGTIALIEYHEGARAAAVMPGLGQTVEAVIVLHLTPPR
jgi:hypothetical protein